MNFLDWIILFVFFGALVGIGIYAYRKVSDSNDFFVGGGKIPWWLSGISHHISGYSGAVFVAFAGLAYTHGIAIYFWWALTIAISIAVGSFFIAPQWSKLRTKLGVQTPTEYISQRFNIPTQLVMAIVGSLQKVFDMGAKWAAIAIILQGFTGISMTYGILLSGGITLMYITIGGLWANVMTDLTQFIIQVVAVFTMITAVALKLGGFDHLFPAFSQLPEAHTNIFNEPYTLTFALVFLFINFLSYNGGTWHLAIRFISAPSGSDARKSALLSAALYLIWPAILFIPMWLAPLIVPNIDNPQNCYIVMAKMLLPHGLIGLVLAGLIANTMAMTSSDSNTISGVIMRDILPKIFPRINSFNAQQSLTLARITTFVFTGITIAVALNVDRFGGVLNLIVAWFGAMLGPIAIPMILGFMPWFKKCGSVTALISIIAGLTTFVLTKIFDCSMLSEALQIGLPTIVSFVIFIIPLFFMKEEQGHVREFFNKMK